MLAVQGHQFEGEQVLVGLRYDEFLELRLCRFQALGAGNQINEVELGLIASDTGLDGRLKNALSLVLEAAADVDLR
ncbi:MAG: hypothetical protein ACXW39_10335, partial [Nitrospira sp.]